MMWIAVQIAIILATPLAAVAMSRRHWLPVWLSPVVFCYVIGIVLGNGQLFPLRNDISQLASELSVALALPLLLFGTQLQAMRQSAGKSLLAFALVALAGLISMAITGFFFYHTLDNGWMVSGMLVGMYTGGTPNMQAIGLALGADNELLILVNAADIFCGGIYLLLLLSIIPRLTARFLPAYQGEKETIDEAPTLQSAFSLGAGKALALSLGINALSLGLAYLLFGNLSNSVFIILSITTLSVAASLIPSVRNWPGGFKLGELFLLMFCVALGLQANFKSLLSNGFDVVVFTAVALSLTIVVNWILAWLFRIDRDTMLIAFTAGIYGPAFIGQVATVIGNKRLIFTGVALGLLGYAVGNYFGIGLALALKHWLLN
ncbi:MAG: DUF819 family protein [Saprospiraceae bacterium]|nr:DUF819 family protein [Saprospiraceae bacterium]